MYATRPSRMPVVSNERTKVIMASTATILFFTLVPYVQFGILHRIWTPDKKPVYRSNCTCGCWDTIFKGSYQGTTRLPGYKHVYFNITKNTFLIWSMTVVVLVAAYECTRYLISLALSADINWNFFALFAVGLYPHYFSWWVYFNAWNDDFYRQWNHQTFFTLTELLSTILVVCLCDKSKNVSPRLCLAIISIAVLHILASGADQFITNVLMGRGFRHQVVRDIGLMIPDLLHIGIPTAAILKHCHGEGLRISNCFTRREIVCAIAGVLALWSTCALL